MHEMTASVANIANLYRLDGIIPSTKPQTDDNIFPPGLAAHSSAWDGGKLHTPLRHWWPPQNVCVCVCMYVCMFTSDCICMCPQLQSLFFGFTNHHKHICGNDFILFIDIAPLGIFNANVHILTHTQVH